MKTIKNYLSIAFVSILLFSCSSEKVELKSYVPASANTLVMINNKAIVDEIKWAVLFGEGKLKFTAVKNPALRLLAENAMESGVDMSSKSYFFTTDSASCLLLPLTSAADLKSFLSANKFEVKENENYSIAQIETTLLVIEEGVAYVVVDGYNDKTVGAFIAGLKDEKSPKLMNAKANSVEAFNSENHIAIYSNENFLSASVEDGVKQIYSLAAGANPMEMLFKGEEESVIKKSKDAEFLVLVNFNNGKLVAKTKQFFENNSLALRAFQKPSALAKSASAFDVNNSIINGALSLDILPFLMARENEEYKHKLDSILEINLGLSSEMVASMLDGDAYFSLNKVNIEMGSKTTRSYIEQENDEVVNVDNVMQPRFYWDAVITLKDTNMARNAVIGLMRGHAPSVKNSIYHFKSLNAFMLFKGFNVYFTSDSATVQKILAAKETDANASFSNYTNGITLNLKDISQKIPVDLANMILPISTIEKNVSTLKYSVHAPKSNVLEGELLLEGTNKDENILLSLLRTMNEINVTPF